MTTKWVAIRSIGKTTEKIVLSTNEESNDRRIMLNGFVKPSDQPFVYQHIVNSNDYKKLIFIQAFFLKKIQLLANYSNKKKIW